MILPSHLFIPNEADPAAGMENQVPEDVVKDRFTVFLPWYRKRAGKIPPVSREPFRKSW